MNSVTLIPAESRDAVAAEASRLKVYFAPLACSLATRIACYEAGVDVDFVQVDTKSKRLASGADFRPINPMGQVPVLEIVPDLRLTENTAVLQYLAERFPAAELAPAGGFAAARFRQWLGFIGTELHKAVFVPLLDPTLDPATHAYARGKAALRLDFVAAHLAGQDHLLDRFSIADAYLATVLNWAPYTGIDLAAWPSIAAFQQRIVARPQVARALAEEFALWKAEQRREAA